MTTTTGKASNSFAVLDTMRIPLGILSGMGFIGAGTILRRENLVLGVTTAATLWFATMIGLCFGGGQAGLGITSTFLGALILWCLQWVEGLIKQERHGELNFAIETGTPDAPIRSEVLAAGFTIAVQSVQYVAAPPRRKLTWQVEWMSSASNTDPPQFLQQIATCPGVSELAWKEVRSNPR